ncbi:hypothetical protein ACU6U9_05275 [Pseudomonas sp. HK3]
MSVVNDILHDLHQRRSQQSYVHSVPFLDEQELTSKVNVSRHLFVMLIVLVISSLVLYFSILSKYEPNTLYENASRLGAQISPQPSTTGAVDDANGILNISATKREPITSEMVEPLNVIDDTQLRLAVLSSAIKPAEKSFKATAVTPVATAQPEKTKKPIIKSAASISAVPISLVPSPSAVSPSVPNSSEPVYQTRRVTKNSQSVVGNVSKDEDLIRKFMIAEPKKVWPYIQKILPVASNKIDLMALGAQGEQRSHQHQTALNLYRTLAEIEPNEAKWKVGSGISLDALSQHAQALRDYKQSLKLNRLPAALNTFVRQRIAQLSGPQHE